MWRGEKFCEWSMSFSCASLFLPDLELGNPFCGYTATVPSPPGEMFGDKRGEERSEERREVGRQHCIMMRT